MGLEDLPLSCVGAPGYLSRLAFWTIAPLVAIVIAVLVSVVAARLAHKPLSEARAGLTPIALRVLFASYTIVTNVAFDGFSCLELDDGDGISRWLAADLSIRCDSSISQGVLNMLTDPNGASEYARIVSAAWLAVLTYPVGVLVLNGEFLARARPAIKSGKPTRFSRSIEFLYRDYRPSFFLWEIVEGSRRFLLVGAFIVGPYERGSMMQLAMAIISSSLYLVLQLIAMPYNTYPGLGLEP